MTKRLTTGNKYGIISMISDFMIFYQKEFVVIAGKEINDFVNAYCKLRDRQTAVYAGCAKMHGLTVNELFVLDILWFASAGCTQKEICDRLSANKQTVNAIITRFDKRGFISYAEVKEDRRNKRIVLTESGKAYAENIIPPAADAENLAMADMPIADVAELVKLTAVFTSNMERRFNDIKEN